jgi:hypothetical protein
MRYFWKLLSDANFTGRPSLITEEQLRKMAKATVILPNELEAAIRGLREFQGEQQKKWKSERSATGEG